MSHDEVRVMQAEQGKNEPKVRQNGKERVKTVDGNRAAFESRQMDDAATALEVDHMILDFLLNQAIAACLDSRRSRSSSTTDGARVDICLFQVDRFQRLFRHRYPSYQLDAELRFRQQLLQLVALTSQRFVKCSSTPPKASLRTLRDRNQQRARQWIGDPSRVPTGDYNTRPFDTALPLSASEIEKNRTHVLQSLDIEPEDEAYEDAFYGTSDSVALMDIVPLFMRVSASCHSMFQSPPTEKWMRLAAGLILQACLEQYLVYGASGSDAIDEAFAWGPRTRQEEKVQDDEPLAQDMEDPFGVDIDQEDVELWDTIKEQALQTILSTESQYWKDTSSHLAAVWARHRLADLEDSIADFLESLAGCVPEPVLVQLQQGQLQGMSREETQTFVKSCGIDVAELLMSSSAHG